MIGTRYGSYYLYKLPLNYFKIDNMEGENDSPSCATRLMYNDRSFFISFRNMMPFYDKKPLSNYVNSLDMFDYEKEIFFVARRIDPNNYLILWLADSEGTELRTTGCESERYPSLKGTLLSFILAAPLVYCFFSTKNPDYSAIYFVFGVCSLLSLFFFIYSFFDSFNEDFVNFNKIFRSDLMGVRHDFKFLDDINMPVQDDLSLSLPTEFNSLRGVVNHVRVKTRKVYWYENISTLSEASQSYKKTMMLFKCDGNEYVLEFKASDTFYYRCDKIPPFIACGDEVELFWYDGVHEIKMTGPHSDVYDNVLPVICVYNRTSNTLFHSRVDITPAGYFEVVGTGQRDAYENYFSF